SSNCPTFSSKYAEAPPIDVCRLSSVGAGFSAAEVPIEASAVFIIAASVLSATEGIGSTIVQTINATPKNAHKYLRPEPAFDLKPSRFISLNLPNVISAEAELVWTTYSQGNLVWDGLSKE